VTTASPSDQSISGSPTSRIGAASISRWRSGVINPGYPPGNAGPDYTSPPTGWTFLPPGVVTTGFPVWSPDGRFFTVLRATTRLTGAPLDPTQCPINPSDLFGGMCAQPAIPLPDRAFAAVFAAAQAGRPGPPRQPTGRPPMVLKWTLVSVDWRPDGNVLAAILPGDGLNGGDSDPTSSSVRVTLYSTATGQPLTTLVAPHPTNSYGLTASAWSPDGAQFALVQSFGDISPIATPAPTGVGTNPFALSTVITIWGASSLAALPSQ